MQEKKEFKLLAMIPRKDGSTYWMKCGAGFTNKDASINVYLDALPKGTEWKFQLRELDEEDLKRREQRPTFHRGGSSDAGKGGDALPF